MDRKRILWIALESVFVIIFNIFFFTLSKADKPASVWVNYFFIHFAYIIMLCTPLMVRKGNSGATDYARPLYLGTWFYFLAAFIVGVVFIIISPETTKASWLVHAGLFAIALIYLLANMLSNEHVADNMERQEQDLKYVKNTVARLKPLITDSGDRTASRKIERLYDSISASPTNSTDKARAVEAQIIGMIADLEDAVQAGNAAEQIRIADEMQKLANRRNSLL